MLATYGIARQAPERFRWFKITNIVPGYSSLLTSAPGGLMRAVLPLVVLAAAIIACSEPRVPESREPKGARATTGDQYHADAGAVEHALRSLRQAHSAAIASKNADSVVTIYAEDVLYLAHGEKPETGRNAARAAWGRSFKVSALRLEYRPEEFTVAASGDLGYERGKVWTNYADPKSEGPTSELREGGNYVYLWKKEDGQWKVGTWMWNWHAES
jgi:ketosteroid isomerase-like protein